MVPTMPEIVITRDPGSSALIRFAVSLARFCCGRIIRKYTAPPMRAIIAIVPKSIGIPHRYASGGGIAADPVA